ncbi:unnamed protein product, partial [Amoebophrya sp. A120]
EETAPRAQEATAEPVSVPALEERLSESMPLRRSEDEEAGKQQSMLHKDTSKMLPDGAKGFDVDLDPEAPLMDDEEQNLVPAGSDPVEDATAPDYRHVNTPFWSSIAG